MIDAVARVRHAAPDANFLLDPVMGDESKGLYVDPGLVDFYRTVCHRADILAPNAFELGLLTGCEISGAKDAATAAIRLLKGRTHTVLVTSVPGDEPSSIVTMAASMDRVLGITTPRLPIDPKGAGDLFMALVAAQLLRGADMWSALERGVHTVWALSEQAIGAPERGVDLPLIDHQDVLTAPTRPPGGQSWRMDHADRTIRSGEP